VNKFNSLSSGRIIVSLGPDSSDSETERCVNSVHCQLELTISICLHSEKESKAISDSDIEQLLKKLRSDAEQPKEEEEVGLKVSAPSPPKPKKTKVTKITPLSKNNPLVRNEKNNFWMESLICSFCAESPSEESAG